MGDPNSRENEIATKMSEQKLTARYCFKRSLGAGGMGEVYLADDTALRRPVAIKTIRPDLCRDPEVRKRIERECLLHAKVGAHPHIVTLYDKLDDGDRINLVMEYVEGETLQGMLERCQKEHKAPDLREALAIASQVLDALSRIHAHGIVHRDIKPANIILIREDGAGVCAKLMDFGIARAQDDELGSRLTQAAGSGPGTPLYMSPEQIDPETFGAISPATDVYAMGILIYQMTSGEPPFLGTITQIFNGHLRGTPPSLRDRARGRVPEALVEIIECALAKQPRERFATAKAFREELLHAMDIAPAPAHAMGEATLPSRAVSADAGRTLRASEAVLESADAGGTMLSGKGLVSGAAVRRQRRALKWIILGVVLISIAAVGWIVLPGLLKGEEPPADTAKSDPAPVEEPSVPVAGTEPAPVVPPPAAGGDAPLPDGFGAQPALPDAGAPGVPVAPAAVVPAAPPSTPEPAPVSPASGVSALDLVTQGLDSRPPDEPAAATPAPAPAAAEPAQTATPKPSKPKTQPKKAEPEPKPEPPKVTEPAKPADSGDFQIKVKSKESYKVN